MAGVLGLATGVYQQVQINAVKKYQINTQIISI